MAQTIESILYWVLWDVTTEEHTVYRTKLDALLAAHDRGSSAMVECDAGNRVIAWCKQGNSTTLDAWLVLSPWTREELEVEGLPIP